MAAEGFIVIISNSLVVILYAYIDIIIQPLN